MKRHVAPADLAKLRKIAAIRQSSPYEIMCAQALALVMAAPREEGEMPTIMPGITTADKFDSKIEAAVSVAHSTIALSNPKKLPTRKQIARRARELANTLLALKQSEKDILVYFLPYRRQAAFDDFVAATRDLADEARHICGLPGKPSKVLQHITQRSFVSHLLDAADEAGGKLTLNVRSERGTLVDAVEVLLPYLREIFPKMPSFSTLKRLRDAQVQNRAKNKK
jgi:hypothetical protein